MAVGASRLHIGKLIADQTLAMMTVGVAMGLGGALIVAPGIRSLFYGVSPHDPKSLLTAIAFLALTAAVSTIVPAIRAMKVDPMVALRYE
jgi:ABC-type antimicrobial peptide transport system permease subunit